NKNYGIFQGWYDGETKLTDDLSYTFTPTAGTYFYNYEAKFVEADSEEFTIAHRLYYGDNSPANTVSALLLRNGRYYILASYCAYDWGAEVGPDEQTFKENEVFVSYGRGTDKDTNDIYLNRSDNMGVYYKTPGDHSFENRALISEFYTEIKTIDFYIDISDFNNINGFDLSIEEHGSLAKCDIIDAKSARVTLYNGDFDYVNNSIAILVPNRQETNRKLVITKVVVHYNHA
ncbi:MAG: hypothetical protein K5925_05275, partial [Bacilli bacterium]|nr:hypothetical protein [Bacilli bacterium]